MTENMEDIKDIDGFLCSECGEIPEILKVHTDNSKIEFNCKKCGKKEILIDDYFDELSSKDYFKECGFCHKKGIYNNKFFYCPTTEDCLCEYCKNRLPEDSQHKYKEDKEKKDHYYYNRCSKCNNKKTDRNKYYYCLECQKDICQKCKKSECKSHRTIEEKEKKKKCLKHNEEFRFFCLQCQANFCKKCKENHQTHKFVEIVKQIKKKNEKENENEKEDEIEEEIGYGNENFEEEKKKIEESLKKVLSNHRDNVIEINKELKNLVEFNETILKYTEIIKSNDFYLKSIENIAKSFKEGDERNSNDIKCLLNGLIKDIENSEKAIELLIDEKEIQLKRNEKYLHLNNRGLGDTGFKYISQIRFNQLKEIDISENKIENIEPFKKMSLPFLEFLNLSDNDIKKIEPITKLNAQNLEYIFLQKNIIEDINTLLDSDFGKLKLLRIEDSKFKEENEEKKNQRSTNLAKIKKNFGERFFFTSMDEHIKQFKKILKLDENADISGDSEIIDLHDKKGNQKMLKNLFLIITSKSINKIKTLILRNNDIKDLSILKRINFQSLETLDLAVNEITNLHFLLEMKAINLKNLYLDNNKFDYDEIFPILNANFPNLEVVSLNKNKFESEEMAITPGYFELKNKKNKKNKKYVIQLEEDQKLNNELNKLNGNNPQSGSQSTSSNVNTNNNASGENLNANNNNIEANPNENNNLIEPNSNENNNLIEPNPNENNNLIEPNPNENNNLIEPNQKENDNPIETNPNENNNPIEPNPNENNN
jgi:hypothetical protein